MFCFAYVSFTEKSITIYRDMTYADIRQKAYSKTRVNIFKLLWKDLDINFPTKTDYEYCICCERSDCWDFYFDDICRDVCAFWVFVIVFPVFLLSKFLQILFPYIIVGFFIYWNKWDEIDLFQLVMLCIYIALQILVFILSILVWRVQRWLWHIEPGVQNIYLNCQAHVDLDKNIKEWYFSKASLPIVEKYVMELFGPDIGKIVMDYVHSIDIGEDESMAQEKEEPDKGGITLTVAST